MGVFRSKFSDYAQNYQRSLAISIENFMSNRLFRTLIDRLEISVDTLYMQVALHANGNVVKALQAQSRRDSWYCDFLTLLQQRIIIEKRLLLVGLSEKGEFNKQYILENIENTTLDEAFLTLARAFDITKSSIT
jgi:hypothetical protein